MNNLRWILAGLTALVIGALLFFRLSAYVIDERELAVILQFGKPVRSIDEPGIYFKVPFIQEVRRFPSTLQFWRTDEDIVDLPTADGKKVEVAAWAVWKIKDPLLFVQALRTVDQGNLAVKDRVRAAVRDEITSHNLSEVVRSTNRELTYSFRFELPETTGGSSPAALNSEGDPSSGSTIPASQPGEIESIELGREKIIEQIKTSVRKRLEGEEEGEINRGIELVDVGISNIGFVPAVREAAFERLKAFMDSIASGYTNSGEQRRQEILNRTDAEVEEILGNGEQQARIIRGNVDAENIRDFAAAITQTGDFYNFVRQLEVYEKALDDRTRLILTTDSEIFRLITNSASDGSQLDVETVGPNED